MWRVSMRMRLCILFIVFINFDTLKLIDQYFSRIYILTVLLRIHFWNVCALCIRITQHNSVTDAPGDKIDYKIGRSC